jgi:hypothetical protein
LANSPASGFHAFLITERSPRGALPRAHEGPGGVTLKYTRSPSWRAVRTSRS